MSCYLVDRQHITYLIEAAEKFEAYIKVPGENPRKSYEHVNKFTHQEKEALGQMLWDENVRSVEGRYPDTRTTREYPGTAEAAEDVAYYVHPQASVFSQEMDFTPAQVFKSIACYDYQSCEHDGWESSDAYRFCHRLMEAVGGKQPGSSEAAWGAPEPWSVRGPKLRKELSKKPVFKN